MNQVVKDFEDFTQNIGSSTHPPKHQTRLSFFWQKCVAWRRVYPPKKKRSTSPRPCFDMVPGVSTMKSGRSQVMKRNISTLNMVPQKWWLGDDPLLLGWPIFKGYVSSGRADFQVFLGREGESALEHHPNDWHTKMENHRFWTHE